MNNIQRDDKGRFIKGHVISDESKKKMSDSHKGKIPWNKGKKNPYSKEILGRMSKSQTERMANPVNHPFFGKHHSIKSKKTISVKLKGHPSWNKGLKGFNSGKINNKWKGDNASYSAIHKWIQYHKSKVDSCEVCGKRNCRLELANLSGDNKRDLSDYKFMCVKCHRTFDNTMPRQFLTPRKELKDLNSIALHRRIRTKYKHNGECQFCGLKTSRLDLSNISGAYLYHIEDYVYLCRKCHAKFDKEKGYNNLKDFIDG